MAQESTGGLGGVSAAGTVDPGERRSCECRRGEKKNLWADTPPLRNAACHRLNVESQEVGACHICLFFCLAT